MDGHSRLSNKDATSFTSLTPDLLRALHIAFYTYRDKSDVRIIIIDPRRLKSGSSLPCNRVRAQCGLKEESIYNTEVLVWGSIPASSIIHQWSRESIANSLLLTGYPAIHRLPQNTNLAALRLHVLQESSQFNATTVRRALIQLGMDPSSMYTKQVYMFLLGLIEGIEVQKCFNDVENRLNETRSQDIKIFESAAYAAFIARGRRQFVTLLREWSEVGFYGYSCARQAGHLHGARCIADRLTIEADEFCPSFEKWLQIRQNEYLQDAILDVTEMAGTTFEGWLSDHRTNGYYIGFAD